MQQLLDKTNFLPHFYTQQQHSPHTAPPSSPTIHSQQQQPPKPSTQSSPKKMTTPMAASPRTMTDATTDAAIDASDARSTPPQQQQKQPPAEQKPEEGVNNENATSAISSAASSSSSTAATNPIDVNTANVNTNDDDHDGHKSAKKDVTSSTTVASADASKEKPNDERVGVGSCDAPSSKHNASVSPSSSSTRNVNVVDCKEEEESGPAKEEVGDSAPPATTTTTAVDKDGVVSTAEKEADVMPKKEDEGGEMDKTTSSMKTTSAPEGDEDTAPSNYKEMMNKTSSKMVEETKQQQRKEVDVAGEADIICCEDVIAKKKNEEEGRETKEKEDVQMMETNETSDSAIAINVNDGNAQDANVAMKDDATNPTTTVKDASKENDVVVFMDETEYDDDDNKKNKPVSPIETKRFHPKRPKLRPLPSSASSPARKEKLLSTTTSAAASRGGEEGGSNNNKHEANPDDEYIMLPPPPPTTPIISPQEYHLRFCLLRKRQQITKDMRTLLKKIMPGAVKGTAAATAAIILGGGGGGGGGSSSHTSETSSTIRSDAATVPRSNRANGLAKGFPPTPTSSSYNSSTRSIGGGSGDGGDGDERSTKSLKSRNLPLPFQDVRGDEPEQQQRRRGRQHHGPNPTSGRSHQDSASGRYCGTTAAAEGGGGGGRRRSSTNWDSLSFDNASVGGGSGTFPLDSISPAPFRAVMTKEYLDKMSGCTPIDDSSGSTSAHRGGNPEAWDRIMTSMMAHREANNMGAGGGDVGRQGFSELFIPSSAMKRTLEEAYNNSGRDRKRSIDHVHQGGGNGGDDPAAAAGMNSDSLHPSKSPLPKKSFLHRERIMDEVMRGHMKEALESFHSHPTSNVSSHFSTPRDFRDVLPHADIAGDIQNLMLPLSTGSGIKDDNTAIDLILDTAKKVSKSKSKSKSDEREKKQASRIKKSKNGPTTKKELNVDPIPIPSRQVPSKPRRPFSAYNLFFQLEREFIMNELNEGRDPQDDPLIKRALSKVREKGGTTGGADDEKKERTTEDIIGVDADTDQPNDDNENATTDDPASSDLPDKDGDAAMIDESTDPQDNDSKTAPTDESKSPNQQDESSNDASTKKKSESKYFVDPDIPPRYKHLRLDKHWFSVSHKQKRKHRKTEGSCSFMELTTMVSARWKLIDATDPHVKSYCQSLAKLELDKYKKDIATYKSELKAAEKEEEALRKQQEADSPKVGRAGLKKRPRKNKRSDAEDIDSPPNPEEHRHTELGSGRNSVDDGYPGMNPNMMAGLDMGRFMELARMSGSIQGALAHYGGGGGGSGGLPPPPFADDSYRNPDDRARIAAEARMNHRARLAAEMAEARIAEARFAAGVGNGRDPAHEATMVEALAMAEARAMADDRRIFHAREAQARMAAAEAYGYDPAAASSIQRKFAALAEAEARHRMQIEMQTNMLGNRGGGGGWSKYDDAPNMPRSEYEMLAAARMSHGSGGPYGDNYPGRPSFPPPPHHGGDSRSASLQRKFMELAGLSEGNLPSHLPNGNSQNFEAEVEHFLSNLGQEIRKNRQKLVEGADADEGGASSATAGGFGGNYDRMVGMGESSARGGGMRMGGDPMGMRAEMLKQMMMGGGNNGGPSSGRSTSGGSGNTSPGAMAEMLMMRKKAAEAARSDYGMSMPGGHPYYGSESPLQRGAGGGGHRGGGSRGGDDDNPALPEYGYGHKGPR